MAGLEIVRGREPERLLLVARLEVERRGPLLRRLALRILVPGRGARAVGGDVLAHRLVRDEVLERDGHEPEVDLVQVAGADLDLRPRGAPVALHLEREVLRLDLGDDVRALPAAERLRPLLRVGGREIVRGDELAPVAQEIGLGGRAERDGLRPPLVAREEGVEERLERRVALLLRLLVERADVFRALQLRHRERVEVAARVVERDQAAVEREALLERLVGDALAVEVDRVAHREVEERRAEGFGQRPGIEERLPVREALGLERLRAGEDLLELRLERRGDLLRRPRRHLLRGGLVVELRRRGAAPAPPARILEVGVREVQLQDGLQRRRLRVDRRGEGREPVLRKVVRELGHRLLAHEERARRVGPALGGDRLALDLRDEVRDRARQVLPRRLVDLLPGRVEVEVVHGESRRCRQRDRRDGEAFHPVCVHRVTSLPSILADFIPERNRSPRFSTPPSQSRSLPLLRAGDSPSLASLGSPSGRGPASPGRGSVLSALSA